jgi:hypothetical protein
VGASSWSTQPHLYANLAAAKSVFYVEKRFLRGKAFFTWVSVNFSEGDGDVTCVRASVWRDTGPEVGVREGGSISGADRFFT